LRSPTEPLSATDYLLCANDKNGENIFTLKLFLLVTVRQRNLCLILSIQLFLCSHPKLHGWSIKPDHSTPYQVKGVFLSWLRVWLPSQKQYQKRSLQPPGMWHPCIWVHSNGFMWLVLTLVVDFFGAVSQTVRCLWPVTDIFQFKTHYVQVQQGLVCAT